MVKKIKLDFSKVEERSGWNTRQMPEALHAMKIVSVEDKEASDGTDMWVFALVPESPKYRTRRFPYYCKLQQNQLWKLRDLFVAAGVAVPKKAQMIDPNKVIGKVVAAEVVDETGTYAGRSSIEGIYSMDVLEDVEDEEADDIEDEEAEEEEYEDDSDDVDEDDDEDEFEEDEDEGDEDDLDDEDLEDEDDDEEYEDEEDDEEEEPEPAPRKRAPAKKPAAPAKKPAAKKAAPAKAAPARRTVKRR